MTPVEKPALPRHATISDAPAVLNTNDRVMWVLGYNEAAAPLLARIEELKKDAARWKQIGWTCDEGACGRIHDEPSTEDRDFTQAVYIRHERAALPATEDPS